MLRLAISAVVATAMPTAALANEIVLSCPGVASKDTEHDLFGTTKTADFNEVVDVKIHDDSTGEARVPKKILPFTRSGKDGWYQVIGIVRTDTEFAGKVRLNSVYKPPFVVNRITGILTIRGDLGNFQGKCESYEGAKAKF